MDRCAFRTVRCFHQNLGQRWVGVDIAGDLVWGQLHHVSQGQLGEQLGHLGTDHVCT